MKKNSWLLLLIIVVISCKEKTKPIDPDKGFFPIVKFIQSEAAAIDTSLYSIYKVTTKDSITSDTTFIRREDFHNEAKDFLVLPDISEAKYFDRFTETKQFDETLGRAIVVYTPVDAKKENIQREEILFGMDGNPTNVIIDYVSNNRDSSVVKKMLWQIDQSFQVTTIKQLAGKPETISTLKVLWNGKEGQ